MATHRIPIWSPCLESPETFRAHFRGPNSLCIFKTKGPRGTKPAIISICILFTTYGKASSTEEAGRSFTNGFSDPKSFRYVRETGPWSQRYCLWLTRCIKAEDSIGVRSSTGKGSVYFEVTFILVAVISGERFMLWERLTTRALTFKPEFCSSGEKVRKDDWLWFLKTTIWYQTSRLG